MYRACLRSVGGFLVLASVLLRSHAATAAEPAPAPTAPGPPADAAPSAPTSAPVEYAVDGDRVVAMQGQTRSALPIEGPAFAVHRDRERLYVARGAAGVSVYDVSEPLAPRLVSTVPTNGHASGFHVVEGQPWVVVVSKSAVPVEGVPPSAGAPGAAPARPQPAAAAPPSDRATPALPARTLSVVRVTPGTVEVDAGKRDGLRPGDRLVVFRTRQMDDDQPSGFAGEEMVGVVEVIAVKDDTALAEAGRGVIARRGDSVRRAKSDETMSTVFPPRMTDVGEASVVLRPLVNAGRPLGIGILADLEASYWGSAYFAGLRLQPVSLGWTDDGSIVSTAALLEGGYEGHAFSVGLGAGVSWVNGDLDYMLDVFGGSSDEAAYAPGERTTEQTQETHTAFTLSQMARLGARDGLNLWIHNLLLLHEDGSTGETGFIYGGTTARITIPLRGRSDLFLEGGGGIMGYWFAGIGVSSWIKGNGSPGSWRLSVSAGAAGIEGSREVTETYTSIPGNPQSYTYRDDVSIVGPMVSVGLARRFDF